MADSQVHRGPDGSGMYVDPSGLAALAHRRLSIIDLSNAGRQPMAGVHGQTWLVFNGEIYNYRELRRELTSYPFHSSTDSEIILAAYERWGDACLDRLVGMFAFAIWDARERRLFAARDRFGVKPFHYQHRPDGTLFFASDVRALQAAGIGREPDAVAWATYLVSGLSDHSTRTFWKGVRSLPAGHCLEWKNGRLRTWCWYDLAGRVGSIGDPRADSEVAEEYTALLDESVRLRFRADVPVGINLSGGLDSSVLLALVHRVQGRDSDVTAFTFTTGAPAYDELPWVRQLLDRTRHRSVVCELSAEEVPALAEDVQAHLAQPYGGLPTLAYARLFERARSEGVIVLLDGQGLDEQWAGYDYYDAAAAAAPRFVQGSRDAPVRPACLQPEFRALAETFEPDHPFGERVADLQYRDARFTKLPRALRFNDGVSMRASTELREPFLDHRLFELALTQPQTRKIRNGRRKALLRDIMTGPLGAAIVEAPKRALQTPQREWLRSSLREWANACIEYALEQDGGAWFRKDATRRAWRDYRDGAADNSFFIWQWVTLGMVARQRARTAPPAIQV